MLFRSLIAAAQELSAAVNRLKFKSPVAYVGNPLDYAWKAHEQYLQKYGGGQKRVVFLGMNPGPFGMAQTGVPFGEVAAVRDWLKIFALVSQPAKVHPKRPVQGFDCTRSEVSGRRLWSLFAERFGAPENFFDEHFVLNYCPLVFCDEGGRNVTPDKLSPTERENCSPRATNTCDAWWKFWSRNGSSAWARLRRLARSWRWKNPTRSSGRFCIRVPRVRRRTGAGRRR